MTSDTFLNDLIIIEPDKPAEACVIWLHGLGADGHDFESLVPELSLPDNVGIRFVFPTAPVQPVGVNMGQPMTAWYDIYSLQLMTEVDWQGVQASVKMIHGLIDDQKTKGISTDQILLAGFSQGGLVALYAALTYPQRLLGVMALSTYFPDPNQAPEDLKPVQRELPIFYAHGEMDDICPMPYAQQSKQILMREAQAVEWHTYTMAHQVCYQELEDIGKFLKQCFVTSS